MISDIRRQAHRVLLVMPPGEHAVFYTRKWKIGPDDFGRYPPLGLLYIASSVRAAGFTDIRVLDAAASGMSLEAVGRFMRDYRPHTVGITSFSTTFADTLEISKAAKTLAGKPHVCVGGPHVKIFPGLTVRHDSIDSVIVGEGESVFPALLNYLLEGETSEIPAGVITKENVEAQLPPLVNKAPGLDELPFPARDLVSQNHYYSVVGIRPECLAVITSRGCPYKCTFCDVPYKTVKTRSVENVINEISESRPGRRTELFFFDDTFNISSARVNAFSEALGGKFKIPWSFRGRVNEMDGEMLRNAAKAGCFQVHLGVETCSDEGLAYLKKDTTLDQVRKAVDEAGRAGIRIIANMMIALPFEKTEAEIYKNIRAAVEMNTYMMQISILELIPGTEIFERAVEKGIASWDEWNEYVKNPYNEFLPKSWDEHIPQGDLGRIWSACYRMVYFRPGRVLAMLFKIKSFWEFRQKFLGALKLLFAGRRHGASHDGQS